MATNLHIGHQPRAEARQAFSALVTRTRIDHAIRSGFEERLAKLLPLRVIVRIAQRQPRGPVAADVVNTMPEKTLEATFDHGEVRGDTITGSYAAANEVMDAVAAQGVSYAEVTEQLEKEGVEKFIVSWNELLDTVTAALEAAKPGDAS